MLLSSFLLEISGESPQWQGGASVRNVPTSNPTRVTSPINDNSKGMQMMSVRGQTVPVFSIKLEQDKFNQFSQQYKMIQNVESDNRSVGTLFLQGKKAVAFFV